MVIMMVFFVLAPLLVFTPHLARIKRIGLLEYGGFAQRYVREFDQKWLRGEAPADEPLVGSGDIQSLADLGNSFEIVKGMKPYRSAGTAATRPNLARARGAAGPNDDPLGRIA